MLIRSKGSPPQVRGKQKYTIDMRRGRGITPAGAGKTPETALERLAFTDHPRRCGENFRRLSSGEMFTGSPPQVRGKHGTMDAKTLDRGITPAGAGKTHLIDQFHFYLRDHPRRCGENA